ncbi:MAG: alpha/beta hydrolase [Clostridia bacterium]|nr:alpha/beta hydrolase [Clostridia bacterium]
MISIKTIINNLNINYIKKGNGKAVLILPGWGTTVNTYMPMINSISSYSTIYCLDMPGFGESEEPNASWNLDNYVTFVINFIKNQNIKEVDLIGHSNGGRIIIKLMSQKNLNFKVNKIVLIGSAGIVHKKTLSQKLKIKISKFCKKILELKPIKAICPNLISKLKNSFGSEDYRNASPVMKQTLVQLIDQDLRELLPNISVPTLLIWGGNDTATPISDGEIMKKLIPDAGLIKVENCSHYVFLERPAYVNKIISTFLNGGN